MAVFEPPMRDFSGAVWAEAKMQLVEKGEEQAKSYFKSFTIKHRQV